MNTCSATNSNDPDFPLACDLTYGHTTDHLNDATGEWWEDPARRVARQVAEDAEYLERRGGAW